MAPSAPPVTTSRDYQLGTSDPPLRQDLGAGFWNSKPKEAGYVALGIAVVDSLPVAYGVIGDDATKHMVHYFRNTGTTYEIDLEGMIAEVPSAKHWYEAEVDQAKQFVEKLDPGRHSITSRETEWGYNRQAESRNWYFAVGGYLYWGKGVADVRSSGSATTCELDFEYKFYDRYNWDAGASVTFAGITVTDKFMVEFHRQGLAREFDCVGSVRRKFSWRKGERIAADQLHPVGGRG